MVIPKYDEIRLPLLTALVAALTLVTSTTAAARDSTDSLLDLAKRKFGAKNLTAAETELFRATQAGERAWAICMGHNLDNASSWSDECTVHVDRLAWLCTDPKAAALVTYRGIEMLGMKVEDDLDLKWAEVKFPFVARSCVFTGTILLQDAQLRALHLFGCRIQDLRGDGVKITGAVYLLGSSKAEGEVGLAGATIGGDVDCSGAQLSNPNKTALNADRAAISGSVFLCDQVDEEGKVIGHFQSNGEVRFPAASIRGDLDCSGAQLSNPKKTALNADRATITGSVLLRDQVDEEGKVIRHFQSNGEVRFPGASIRGDLDCEGAQLSNPDKAALNADDVKVQGNLYLRKRFKCDGQLSLWYANIAHDLQIRELDESEKMTLILRSATAGTFLDDTGSWPKKGAGKLFLDGFTYERIDARAPIDAVNRIEWLHRQPQDMFLPQPYEQLASVLLKMGHERTAKQVIIQKNLDHAEYIARTYEGVPFLKGLARFHSHEWWWYNVIGKAIGYGYRPGRAFLASFVFILLGWVLFRVGYIRDLIAPLDAKAYEKDSQGRRVLVESYPRFNAFVYSLESFVPLIKFDQSENWAPNANHAGGRVIRYYLYLHIAAGWILTTLWVGAVTGLVKS